MDKKLKVAIVYKDLGLGGVQKKIIDISNRLIDEGDVELFIILAKAKGEFLEKVPSQAKLVDLDIPLHPPHIFLLPVKLAMSFLKNKPKVILALMDTYGCSSVLAARLMGKNKPKIFISQNVHASGFFKNRLFPWLRKLLVFLLYPKADAVISLSKTISDDLIRKCRIPPEKIILIRNWVKTESLGGKEKKEFDFLYTGRLASEKNLLLLVNAFAQVLKKRPQSSLCLLGYGPQEGEIRDRLAKLKIQDRVFFPGFSHNVKRYLEKSRVFVMTSKNEGTPMAMLEAMASNIPVITTGFPGSGEVVIHKKTGIIANSQEEISHWMLRLLEDNKLAERLADQATDMLKKRYPPENLHKLTKTLISA